MRQSRDITVGNVRSSQAVTTIQKHLEKLEKFCRILTVEL